MAKFAGGGLDENVCRGFAPPPYQVALLEPDSTVVFGHQENEKWVELWTMTLLPQADGSTRLIARNQTTMVGDLGDRPSDRFCDGTKNVEDDQSSGRKSILILVYFPNALRSIKRIKNLPCR